MENNLADQLIEANREEVEEERKIDEYGLPLPQKKGIQAHCNYLAARAIYLNKHLYTRDHGRTLWNSHEIVQPRTADIARLARWAEPISKQSAAYIYDKIKELVPYLDESKIAITPNLLWDIEKQELIETKEVINVISDW